MSEASARRARALEYHLAGMTYQAIADAVGYAGKSGAFQAVKEALAAAEPPSDGSTPASQTELARLDAMLAGLWPMARRGDVQAVDRVMRIEERRAVLKRESAPVIVTERKATPLDELASRRISTARAPRRAAKRGL